jgi:hypothetical protein
MNTHDDLRTSDTPVLVPASTALPRTAVSALLKCRHCGDVIGAYEPLVLITPESVRESSRAAEPNLSGESGERYHRACYEATLATTRQ